MEQIKEITINGRSHKITEKAYRMLADFMKFIKKTLKEEGKYSDAEIQISILLDMETENRKQDIIDVKIINEVIKVMKENHKIKFKQKFYEDEKFIRKKVNYKKKNRLQRDKREKIISGVCAGIAKYIGIDPLYVRLFFLIATLFRGFFIPVYIILWIILPSNEPKSKWQNTVSP